jgi:hypothetical protein
VQTMLQKDEGTKKNNSARMKMLDRVIKSYQAQKLKLKAQEIEQQESINEKNRGDLSKRMRTAYNKNKHKIKNAEPDKKNNTRQRKIDDLQNRPNSWLGLHERQYNLIKKQEEFDYGESNPNPFSKFSWEEVCDTIEIMNEKEMDELMDACGVNNIDDLYEYVATCFSLEEA